MGAPLPMVSVVMPAYNAARYIHKAIAAVQAQTFPAWELIVVDDGSTDGTGAVVKQLMTGDSRIHLLRNAVNRGTAASRNKAILQCRGRYVAFVDSDDIWHAEKLERQLQQMEHTGAQLCYTSYALVDPAGKKIRPDYIVPASVGYNALLKENVIGCSTVMLESNLLKKHLFREDFYHEDYALWLQLLGEGCQTVGCTEVLVDWCYQPHSRSYNKVKCMRNRWKIYRQHLGFPWLRCVGYLCCYAVRGVRKYRSFWK